MGQAKASKRFLGFAWICLGLLGLAWFYLGLLDFAGVGLGLLGFAWVLLGLGWFWLDLLGFAYVRLGIVWFWLFLFDVIAFKKQQDVWWLLWYYVWLCVGGLRLSKLVTLFWKIPHPFSSVQLERFQWNSHSRKYHTCSIDVWLLCKFISKCQTVLLLIVQIVQVTINRCYFHQIPGEGRNKELRKRWLNNIRRAGDLPKDRSFYICSEHFEADCYERDFKVKF